MTCCPPVRGQTDPVLPKYEPLKSFLEGQPAGEVVTLPLTEIDRLVGGLPPSSARRTWWADSAAHLQAQAWLQAGRRVLEVRPGNAVVFSPSSGRSVVIAPVQRAAPTSARPRSVPPGRGLPQVADGVAALDQVLRGAGYPSITAAVAAHTVFLHPDTVAQTGGQPLFPVVRNPNHRRELIELPDGRVAMFDDNTTPPRPSCGRLGAPRDPTSSTTTSGETRGTSTPTRRSGTCAPRRHSSPRPPTAPTTPRCSPRCGTGSSTSTASGPRASSAQPSRSATTSSRGRRCRIPCPTSRPSSGAAWHGPRPARRRSQRTTSAGCSAAGHRTGRPCRARSGVRAPVGVRTS